MHGCHDVFLAKIVSECLFNTPMHGFPKTSVDGSCDLISSDFARARERTGPVYLLCAFSFLSGSRSHWSLLFHPVCLCFREWELKLIKKLLLSSVQIFFLFSLHQLNSVDRSILIQLLRCGLFCVLAAYTARFSRYPVRPKIVNLLIPFFRSCSRATVQYSSMNVERGLVTVLECPFTKFDNQYSICDRLYLKDHSILGTKAKL